MSHPEQGRTTERPAGQERPGGYDEDPRQSRQAGDPYGDPAGGQHGAEHGGFAERHGGAPQGQPGGQQPAPGHADQYGGQQPAAASTAVRPARPISTAAGSTAVTSTAVRPARRSVRRRPVRR